MYQRQVLRRLAARQRHHRLDQDAVARLVLTGDSVPVFSAAVWKK